MWKVQLFLLTIGKIECLRAPEILLSNLRKEFIKNIKKCCIKYGVANATYILTLVLGVKSAPLKPPAETLRSPAVISAALKARE